MGVARRVVARRVVARQVMTLVNCVMCAVAQTTGRLPSTSSPKYPVQGSTAVSIDEAYHDVPWK